MTTIPEGYEKVWAEAQNQEVLTHELWGLRRRLHRPGEGEPCIIILQPGDGTRYRFLLVPEPRSFTVSDDGREPDKKYGDEDVLYVTVLDGLGNGTAQIHRRNGIDGIRYRIADMMNIRNVCTAEALAQTVLAVWGYTE